MSEQNNKAKIPEILNQTLYNKHKYLVISVYKLLLEETNKGLKIPETVREEVTIKGSLITTSQIIETDFQTLIYWYEKEIKSLKEYTECFNSTKEVIKSDKDEILKQKIIGFLIYFQKKAQSIEFNENTFNEFYKEYEDYIFADKIIVRDFSLLQNFECDVQEIEFNEKLKIRRLSDQEIAQLYNEDILQGRPYDTPFSWGWSKYVLEIIYERKKKEHNHGVPIEMFEKVSTALRLFKSGNVGLGERLYSIPINWAPREEKSGLSGVYPKIFLGNRYRLIKSDEKQFNEFINEFLSTNITESTSLNIALTRFNYAYERERPEDRLIDLMISFEALFLKGGEKQELNYRLALRTAVLLENNGDGRNKIFSSMREAYNARSKIVHGETMSRSSFIPHLGPG